MPDEWADDAADLPMISDFMPSEEAVLELEPDLVYSGWESAFAPDAAGDRDELASLGVASYVQPAACRSAGRRRSSTSTRCSARSREVASDLPRRPDRADRRPAGDARRDRARRPRAHRALVLVGHRHPLRRRRHRRAPARARDRRASTNIAGDIDQTWTLARLGVDRRRRPRRDRARSTPTGTPPQSKIALPRGEPGDREARRRAERPLPHPAVRLG